MVNHVSRSAHSLPARIAVDDGPLGMVELDRRHRPTGWSREKDAGRCSLARLATDRNTEMGHARYSEVVRQCLKPFTRRYRPLCHKPRPPFTVLAYGTKCTDRNLSGSFCEVKPEMSNPRHCKLCEGRFAKRSRGDKSPADVRSRDHAVLVDVPVVQNWVTSPSASTCPLSIFATESFNAATRRAS